MSHKAVHRTLPHRREFLSNGFFKGRVFRKYHPGMDHGRQRGDSLTDPLRNRQKAARWTPGQGCGENPDRPGRSHRRSHEADPLVLSPRDLDLLRDTGPDALPRTDPRDTKHCRHFPVGAGRFVGEQDHLVLARQDDEAPPGRGYCQRRHNFR